MDDISGKKRPVVYWAIIAIAVVVIIVVILAVGRWSQNPIPTTGAADPLQGAAVSAALSPLRAEPVGGMADKGRART